MIKLVGGFKTNKYGTGEIQLIASPLQMDDCFTAGIKVSKFSAGKYTIGVQLSPNQIVEFNELMVGLKESLKETHGIEKLKTGLYGKTLYVKLMNDITANDFLEDGKSLAFHEVYGRKDFNANFVVNMRGVFVNENDEGFLQLTLSRLVFLKHL